MEKYLRSHGITFTLLRLTKLLIVFFFFLGLPSARIKKRYTGLGS